DFTARLARLEAERDGAAEIQFPAELEQRARAAAAALDRTPVDVASVTLRLKTQEYDESTTPEIDAARAIAAEQRLFDLRTQAREGQKAQLRERILQLRDEVTGYSGQVKAKGRE